MALCENCKNKSCGYASEDVIRCGDFEENIAQTNADRIRAMSDEELLGFLMQVQHEAGKRFAAFKTPNYNEVAEWLKQPAKEDAE